MYVSSSQTFCDATHLKKLARLCDAPDSILQFSLPYCEINVTHNTGLHLKKFLLIEQIACISPNFGALSSKITFVFAYHVKFFCKKFFNFLQI